MGQRFKREDWLDFGLKQLAESGPEALKLNEFCEAAGKTIGSFYHHFADQSEFFGAMMQHWQQKNTQDVIAQTQDIKEPEDRAKRLEAIVGGLDQEIEVGVRSFSQQNKMAAEIVAEVDEMRIGFLQEIHSDLRWIDDAEARRLAELEYAAFVGFQVLWPKDMAGRGQELSALLQKMAGAHFERSS